MIDPESQVRTGLPAGGKRIRTCGPARERGRSETCGIDPRSFGPRGRHQFRRGTNGSNPVCATGESKANPIPWIMADAEAKKLAGAMPITGFGRLLRKH
jgi:hypothetical protein